MPKLPPARLREAFFKDLFEVWEFFRREFREHQPYAFLLYGDEGAVRFHAQVLTEQGLAVVADRYVAEQIYETLDEARKALRFSIADSPLFGRFLNNLPSVDALIEPHADELGDPAGFEILAKAAMAALKKLDKERFFGEGDARENLLLMISTFDTEFEITDKSVKSLNSKSAAKRFTDWNKVDGPWNQCERFAVSADGKSILADVKRDASTPKSNQSSFVHELISYEVIGSKLRRCLTYVERTLTQGCTDVAALPGNDGFIVLRGYWTDDAHSVLIHVSPTSQQPLNEQEILGRPARLTISRDGSRIAVAMVHKQVSVLDERLKLLYEFHVPIEPESILFLPTGELLVGGSEEIVLYEPTTEKVAEVAKLPGRHMAVDPAGKILATSQWFTFGDDSEQPFGITLVSLPSFDILRKLEIPGRQITSPSISPDGKRLAVVVDNPAKYQSSRVFIYDLASGAPVTDFACHHNWPVHFFPDSHRIAFAGTHFGSTAPIWVSTVPED